MQLSTNGTIDLTNGDFTVNGECSKCGECCGDFLPLTEKEIAQIKKYIKKHDIKEYKNFPLVAVNYLDMSCPFRDNSKGICTIYEIRPSICRAFMCNYSKKEFAKQNPNLFKEERIGVFMRKTFFESDDDKAYIENIVKIMEASIDCNQ
jgi:Fe-S-cluster containining protein